MTEDNVLNNDEEQTLNNELNEGACSIQVTCTRTDCQYYSESEEAHCSILDPQYILEDGEGCMCYLCKEEQKVAAEDKPTSHKRGTKELKINPDFKKLVPQMTRDEFNQLEQNIKKDGRIREPIVCWNGYIIDGHHRYQIAQENPEIEFDTIDMQFDSEDDAIVWICNNQLGRRNVTPEEKKYLIGKKYEAEKRAKGAPEGNQNAKKQLSHDESFDSERYSGTAKRLAKEYGISKATVERAGKFTRGTDIAEDNAPGAMEKIRNSESHVPDKAIENIENVDPEVQKEAAEAIVNGDSDKAKELLMPAKDTAEDENDTDKEPEGCKEASAEIDDHDLTTPEGMMAKMDELGDEWSAQITDLLVKHGYVFDSLDSIKAAAMKFKDQIDKLQKVREELIKTRWDEKVDEKINGIKSE